MGKFLIATAVLMLVAGEGPVPPPIKPPALPVPAQHPIHQECNPAAWAAFSQSDLAKKIPDAFPPVNCRWGKGHEYKVEREPR